MTISSADSGHLVRCDELNGISTAMGPRSFTYMYIHLNFSVLQLYSYKNALLAAQQSISLKSVTKFLCRAVIYRETADDPRAPDACLSIGRFYSSLFHAKK